MTDLRNFKGGRELQEALDQLPAKLEANIMRGALRAGAKVLLEEARSQVPVESGQLRDSLKVSVRSKRGQVSARVSTPLFYAHFVEFGTAPHEIKPKRMKSLFLAGAARYLVQHPGARAKPFLRPAMDSKANAALVVVGEKIRQRLTKQGINAPEGIEVDE